MTDDKIVPYYPLFARDPFQLIRYEVRDFNDGYGNGGKVRVAIYCKKKEFNSPTRTELEMDAQVMWEYREGKPI